MKITRTLALILASLSLGATACANTDSPGRAAVETEEMRTEDLNTMDETTVGAEDDQLIEEGEVDSMEAERTPASVEEQSVEDSAIYERPTDVSAERSEIGHTKPEDLSKEEIRSVQQALNQRGYDLAVDGIFGPETRRAVTQFQANNNIEQTGNLTQETLTALNVERGERLPASVEEKKKEEQRQDDQSSEMHRDHEGEETEREPASVPSRNVETGEMEPMGTSEQGTDLGTGRTMTDEGVESQESQIDATPDAQ